MNRDLALTNDEGAWPLDSYSQAPAVAHRVEQSTVLDLPTLLRIIQNWRWLILTLAAAGAALGIAYALVTTPMYRAWVMLQVNPPTVEILDEGSSETVEGQSTWSFVATQVGLLRSTSLARRAAQELNLVNTPGFVENEEDPQKRLQAAATKVHENLTVIPPEEGQLIQFNFVSDSPEIAARVANGLAEAFIGSNLELRYEASAYARKFLERQIAKTRGELEKSERQLVAYAQTQGIINTGSGQSGTTLTSDAASPQGDSLLALNKALAEATARRVAAQGAYQAALRTGVTSSETASSQSLRQTRATLQAQYEQRRTALKPDHPEMVSLRSQIDELNRQIGQENASVARGRVNTLRADYQAASAAERALQSRIASLKGEVLDLRGRSIRYAILQRDVDTNRALYEALLQRYKEIGVAGGVGASPVSIVDRADVPAAPYKPNVLLDVLVGAAAGLLLGLLAAVGLEYLHDTINTRDDVRKKLGLACLGSVPKRRTRENFVEELRDPSSPISEAYSTVAASLGFSTEGGAPKVLLLTSARPSEGKSSSALALAQNFARRGASILLIDCDLRKPAFKARSPDKGLTKLLTNKEPISAHVSATHFQDLWLLPAGTIPPNPADLLSTGRFGELIREASRQFDMLIIDAPPVLGLADSPLLASIAKNVLFVIESGKTRTSVAREAVTKLNAAGAHILGVALTKSADDGRSYGYGYGYGYGYKHRYGGIDKKSTEIALVPD